MSNNSKGDSCKNVICLSCQGKGKYIEIIRKQCPYHHLHGGAFLSRPCTVCNGTGYVYYPMNVTCKYCNGAGSIKC